MTLYSKDVELSSANPLRFLGDPEAYQLRLIDDDEDYFVPFYDVGPLERKDEIGEFESLAFLESKNYKKASSVAEDELDQEQEKLKREGVSFYSIYHNAL
jgi:hypothetical protein